MLLYVTNHLCKIKYKIKKNFHEYYIFLSENNIYAITYFK